MNFKRYPRGERHPRARHPDTTVKQARQLSDEGMSVVRIAERLGVNYYTAFDWCSYRTRTAA